MPIFNGTSVNDSLNGSPDADTLIGFVGDDTILGLEGDDSLSGDEGSDILYGNQGQDTVRGGQQDDLIHGGQDNDQLFGDENNDTIYGDLGNDTVFGGDGDDWLFGDQGLEADFSGIGNDVLDGGLGNDTILGLGGNDQLLGGDGNDALCGNEGSDTVRGGIGNDLLWGGKDNDQLFGDAGNDVLFGDLGADTITGGEGNDTFIIGRRSDVPGFLSTGGLSLIDADLVTDFTVGQDLIELIGGLTFEQLNIFQGSGINSTNAVIQDKVTGQFLAILKDVNVSSLSGSDFTPPGATPTPPPPVGTLQFGAPTFSVNEDGTVIAAVTITRTGGSSGAVSVPVLLNGGTAIGGASPLAAPKDYDNSFVTVNWADGDTAAKTVTIPIFNDTEVEGNEAVNLTLGIPTGGATTGAQNTAVFTIVDNDTQPPPTNPGSLSFTAANYSGNEGNSGAPNKIVATIQRTDGSEGVVSVQVQLGDGSTATAADDFVNNLPITVTFNPGETSKNVELPIVGDTTPEGNETINLKLANSTGGATLGSQATAIYTITNDDIAAAPEIEVLEGATNIADGTATVNFGSTTVGTEITKILTVKNTGTGVLNLDSLNLPNGFSLVDGFGSSTLAAGAQTTFSVKLNAAAAGDVSGTLSFGNNDSDENPFDFTITGTVAPPPTVSITATDSDAIETGNAGTFRIERTGSTDGALTVNLAIDGSSTVTSNADGASPVDYDFSVSGGGSISGTGATRTLIIPAGQSFVDVTFTPIDDEHAEADETLKLNLASGGYTIDGTNKDGTVTIAANDTVVINTNDSVDNYTLQEGSLRQAMLNAIAFAGADTISFAGAAASGTINLAGALPELTGANANETTINGLGANLLTVRRDTGGAYRILTVDTGVNFTVSGLTIANGNGFGGGIYNKGGTVNITNSALSGNTAEGSDNGGGIYNDGGTVNLTNSTLSSNTAFSRGGAIYNANGSTVNLTNSTISGNTASDRGGGIFNDTSSTVNVTNSTIASNAASDRGGGIFNDIGGTLSAKNTIVAQNTALTNFDFDGTLTSQGYNLISNTTGTTIGGTTIGNILDFSANLGPLQNNGGPTQTMALLPGSPAINAGDPAFTSPPDTDQRGTGFNRISNNILDLGAFESNLSPTLTASIVATDTAASENGGNDGEFLITLNSPAPVGGLEVNFTTGGNATFGTSTDDYKLTGAGITTSGTAGKILIPEGATSAKIIVQAIDDLVIGEVNELAILTLTSATAGFTIGTLNSAAVSVDSNDWNGISDPTILSGNNGSNKFQGNDNGVDTINPGGGADIISWVNVPPSGVTDRIVGFAPGQDKFQFPTANFGNLSVVSSVTVQDLGAGGTDITGKNLIIFDELLNVANVDLALTTQKGTSSNPVFFAYSNNGGLDWFVGYDPSPSVAGNAVNIMQMDGQPTVENFTFV